MYPRQRPAPKMMRVSPTVTDPNMKSEKADPEELLRELGEDEDTTDMKKAVFGSKKTKEELAVDEGPSTNTMLYIVFALIVITLVVLVVWLAMKQNEPLDEFKAHLHPARMPPYMQNRPQYPYGPNHQMQAPASPRNESRQESRQETKPEPKHVSFKPETKPESKPDPKSETKPESKPVQTTADELARITQAVDGMLADDDFNQHDAAMLSKAEEETFERTREDSDD